MNPEELRQIMEGYPASADGAGEAELAALEAAARQDPALQAQWEAVRKWDVAIAKAMADVPVPDGLAQRLLQGLEQHGSAAGEVALGGAALDRGLSQPVRQWWSRWPARLALAGAAAALILAIGMLFGLGDNLTATQVAREARGWLGGLDEEGWLQTSPPAEAYECIDDSGLRFQPLGWQSVATRFDPESVVFQAALPPDRARAWLFVIDTRLGRHLPDRCPTVPDSTTGRLCVGVWKSDGRLCVLAVKGSQQTYSQLLPASAIARLDLGGKEKFLRPE